MLERVFYFRHLSTAGTQSANDESKYGPNIEPHYFKKADNNPRDHPSRGTIAQRVQLFNVHAKNLHRF